MDIKSAVKAVGDCNRYQVYTILFVSFKWMIVAFLILGPSYLFMTPTFTCGTKTKVSQEDACGMIDLCQIENIYTVTAANKLYCDDRYIRDGLLSSEYIGSVAGLIILSILADQLGRKLIINVTLLISLLGTIVMGLGATYNNYWTTGAGIVLMGLGGYSLSIVSFIYLGEVCNDRWRQFSIILSYTFWAVAEMLFYPIITYAPDWKFMVLWAMIVPLVVLIVLAYALVQTPQFLYTRSKKQCLEVLNYIAKFNGKNPLSAEEIQPPSQSKEVQYEIKDTLLKWQFLFPLIILSFSQICNNAMYYITQYSVNQIGSSFQMNMLVVGALEFVGYFITNLYCHKMKRKIWLILFMTLSGVIGILFQFVFRNSQSNQWDTERYLETAVIGVSRLANTFGFGLFSLLTTESFPQSIKTTGTGIVQAMSNLGNMASPFLVTLSQKIHMQSMFIGGIVCIAGALSLLPAKQTLVVEQRKQRTESNVTQPFLTQSTLEANAAQPQVQARN